MIQRLRIIIDFFHLFKNSESNTTRYSFNKYFMPVLGIKYFNGLIDIKAIFNQPVKSNKNPADTRRPGDLL